MRVYALFNACCVAYLGFICLFAMPISVVAVPNFQEEFNGEILSSDWTPWDGYALSYPSDTDNHANYQLTGSSLAISFPGGREHNQWWLKHAQLTHSFEGSGVYEIKVNATLDGTQQFGLVFENSPGNFMMFMLYSTDQVHAYVERFANLDGIQYRKTVVGEPLGLTVPDSGPYYLRVVVEDNPDPTLRSWKFDWSKDGIYWSEIFSGFLEGPAATDNMGAIQNVGLFAGNQPWGFDGFEAQFDYFHGYANLPLEAPANLVARGGDQQVELWWDPVRDADYYGVYRSPNVGGPYSFLGTSISASYSDLNIVNDSQYGYVVTAFKEGVETPISLETAAIPHVLTGIEGLPTDGLLLALSAQELAYQLDDGDPVNQWINVRGPRIIASGSLGHAPTFVTEGINNQAVVRFDGIDDFLELTAGFDDFTAGVSLYLVARTTALQSGFKLLTLGNGAGQQNIVFGRAGSTAGLQYFTNDSSGSVAWFNTTAGIVAGETALFSVIQSGGAVDSSVSVEVASNDTIVGGGNVYVPPIAMRGDNFIGKSYWNDGMFQGDIAEIIIYNRALNDQEQSAVYSYLSQRYAINIAAEQPVPLQAPVGIAAEAGDSNVSLSWSAVSGASGYRVYRTSTIGGSYELLADTVTTNFADITVSNDSTYYYVVSAYNGVEESALSAEVAATPQLAQSVNLEVPTSLSAGAGDNSVSLRWGTVSGAIGYRVYRSGNTGGSYEFIDDIAVTDYVDATVANGTTYYYVITAYNNLAETDYSVEVAVTPEAPPSLAIPTAGLVLLLDAANAAQQYNDGDNVTVWQDSFSGHNAVSGAGAPVLVASAINGQPALHFDGVYDYLTLTAGFEDFTAGVSIYVVARPTVLQSGFKLLALGNGAARENVVLGRAGNTAGLQYFTDNSNGAVGWFNTDSGVVAGETALYSVIQSGGVVDSYTHAEVAMNGTVLGSGNVYVPPVTTRNVNYIGKSYWSDGLFQGEIAEIIVYNRTLGVDEQNDIHDYVTQKYALNIASVAPQSAALPEAPSGLLASAGDGSVSLTWNAVSGAAGYRVYRTSTAEGVPEQLAELNDVAYTDIAVTNGATYYYAVSAYNEVGESVLSTEVFVTPASNVLVPLAVPVNLTASVGDNSVFLNWSTVPEAAGYRIYRSMTSDGVYDQVADVVSSEYTDVGVTNGATYYYAVTAYNDLEETAYSAQVTAIPELTVDLMIPTDGLALSLDANDAMLQYNDGEAVTVWHDSHSGHDAVAGSGAPVMVVNAINGQPALRFDGIDDFLAITSGFEDFTAGVSLYVVARPSVLQSGFKLIALGNGAGRDNLVLGRGANTARLQYFTDSSNGAVGWFNTSAGLVAGEAALFSVTQGGGAADSNIYAEVAKNGNLIGGSNVYVPPVVTRSVNYIGKSYWNEGVFQGDIAEIIIYNRILNATEQNTVESYISQKYGLPLP